MFQEGKKPGGPKVSQETQSSVTKLFKMLKDTYSDCSSETVNLMKSKRKTKSNTHTDKSCECAEAGQQTNGNPHNRDDTFSFTSCSLKKMLTQEAPKVMMALIIIVCALGIILVLKCICCPAIITDLTEERRDRRSDDAIQDRKPWEISRSRLMNEVSELTGKDTKESNLRSGDVDYPEYMVPELASILDPIKVNEGYGSNNLREFYRKLLKTDIQIKNLKKGFTNIKHGHSLDFVDPNTSRLRRSVTILADPAGSHDESSTINKRSLENRNEYYSSEARTADNDDRKVQDDFDVAQPDPSLPLKKSVEEPKLPVKEWKPEHTEKGDVLSSSHQPASSKAKNALEQFHFKHHEFFNALFGKERSTQHRRLLQQDDEEDNDEGENGDYEDQTKEPWDREKRKAKPVELNTEKQTESERTVNLPKTANSEKQEPKSLYGDEINYIIEAAMRMNTGKPGDLEYREKYLNALINSNSEYFEDDGNYADLVKMAQAYSDYGVLNSKKEIIEKSKPLGNTIKLLASEKRPEILEQKNKVDNPLHGERVKSKSSSEKNTEKTNFLKKFKLKMFSNGENTKTKDNILETATAISSKITNYTRSAIASVPWNRFTLKKAQKHKERNLTYSGHRRSLKSIEIEELNDEATDIDNEPHVNNTETFENNEDNTTTIYFNVYTNGMDMGSQLKHDSISDIMNETNNRDNIYVNLQYVAPKLSESTLKSNSSGWGLGEIFGIFADFCMFLSGFDENQEGRGYRFLYDLVTMLNPNYLKTKNKTTLVTPKNVTRAPLEASIDSEMVDNIGHRSRVLMSFEEKSENSTVNGLEESRTQPYVITTNNENTNTTKRNQIANTSNIENKNAAIEAGNRNVVKRSANGNVIFWNDLYDDEYGVKDPMEDDMKDKSSVKFNDLVSKDNWISNKFKMLTKNLKERRNRKMEAKNRKFKSSRNKTKTHNKRAVPGSDGSGKQMFESLTANMKKVCHEAAQAIRDTTNREVRADGNQASSLMQQLVSLMSELVDLQVRAKTCVQLPEDLRSFLAWLTSPNTEERDDIGFSVYDAGPSNLRYPETYDFMSTNVRSECLGTIHDVEDLIMQYDEMSEEDKSKMSGVREYLEHQLHYLHKQLSSFNEYGSAVIYQEEPIRKRRHPDSIKSQRKRRAYRFLNYGRKHTKATDFDDFATEDYKPLKFNRNKNRNEYYKHDSIKDRGAIENNDLVDNEIDDRNNVVKRDLKDGYFSGLMKNNGTILKFRT